MLDLDDLGAPVGEQRRRRRDEGVLGDLEDPNPVQNCGHRASRAFDVDVDDNSGAIVIPLRRGGSRGGDADLGRRGSVRGDGHGDDAGCGRAHDRERAAVERGARACRRSAPRSSGCRSRGPAARRDRRASTATWRSALGVRRAVAVDERDRRRRRGRVRRTRPRRARHARRGARRRRRSAAPCGRTHRRPGTRPRRARPARTSSRTRPGSRFVGPAGARPTERPFTSSSTSSASP